MKYIVTELDGKEEIFIFPDSVNHDCMDEAISRIKSRKGSGWVRLRRRAISAGFITRDGKCYGRSETLNLSSREDLDTQLYRINF